MPLLSIIVPIYNDEKYLTECINSVLIQNCVDVEIILVNDASTDSSSKICSYFESNYDCVNLICNRDNIGAALSRNLGIRASSGRYVAFLDSDDKLIDGSLTGLSELLETGIDIDFIITKWKSDKSYASNEQLFTNNNSYDGKPFNLISHINKINYYPDVCWHYVISREFILKNRLYFVDAKVGEDQEFVVRLLCLAKVFGIFEGDYLWHRDVFNSLKDSVDLDTTLGFVKICAQLCEFLQNNTWPSTVSDFLVSRIKYAFGSFSVRLLFHSDLELSQIGDVFENRISKFSVLEKNCETSQWYKDLISYGAFGALSIYRNRIVNQIRTLIDDVKYEKLFLFCAGLHARAIGHVLFKLGHQPSGIIDNDSSLVGEMIGTIPICGPVALSPKNKSKSQGIFVVVCAQRAYTVQAIRKQLASLGLKHYQIAHLTF